MMWLVWIWLKCCEWVCLWLMKCQWFVWLVWMMILVRVVWISWFVMLGWFWFWYWFFWVISVVILSCVVVLRISMVEFCVEMICCVSCVKKKVGWLLDLIWVDWFVVCVYRVGWNFRYCSMCCMIWIIVLWDLGWKNCVWVWRNCFCSCCIFWVKLELCLLDWILFFLKIWDWEFWFVWCCLWKMKLLLVCLVYLVRLFGGAWFWMVELEMFCFRFFLRWL